MTDPLPVPAQLEAQLGKCRSVRNDTFRKGRDKTPQVRGQLVSPRQSGAAGPSQWSTGHAAGGANVEG